MPFRMFTANETPDSLFRDRSRFVDHIVRCLGDRGRLAKIYADHETECETSAGVVMLLGVYPAIPGKAAEPCVVLNKRSLKVNQPGDLCFPGGRIAPRLDPYLARLLSLRCTSFGRWHHRGNRRQRQRRLARSMSILWATGLRESFEEMKLNPFGVRFLGPLPPQTLVMFTRTIYPMVGWIKRQKRFFPNWEVEKVVYLPLQDLLDPALYSCYRLRIGNNPRRRRAAPIQDYPCFRIQAPNHQEILWGATYRITIDFLAHVFGFKPPALETRPVVEGVLDENYLTGNK